MNCPSCGTENPDGFRFCGNCGTKMQGEAAAASQDAEQAKLARLILIKGEGGEGIAYPLKTEHQIAGRTEGALRFPDDVFLSPAHASFYYDDGKLYVHDEGSLNGVFFRVKKPLELHSGKCFLVGEQLLRFEELPEEPPSSAADDEGVMFYSSPKRPGVFRLVQVLCGNEIGMVYRAPKEQITIGREGNDINFPDDPFISGQHAQVKINNGNYILTDLSSKNGTFVRADTPTQLEHGDYLFLGQQLLRVELH